MVVRFVNPRQFAPEDLSRYPGTKRDLEVRASLGVDLVWAPSVDQMYPRAPRSSN